MQKVPAAMIVVIIVSNFAIAEGNIALFQKGEKWVYKHEGPRSMTFLPENATGERIRTILSAQEESDAKRWIIEERYTALSDKCMKFYVDEKRLMTKSENEEGGITDLNPPFPFDWLPLKINEEKIFEMKYYNNDRITSYIVKGKRLADETIDVPAGKFTNCQHFLFRCSIVITVDGTDMIRAFDKNIWFHEDVNGIVKETAKTIPYEFGNQTMGGTISISRLIKYSKEDIKP